MLGILVSLVLVAVAAARDYNITSHSHISRIDHFSRSSANYTQRYFRLNDYFAEADGPVFLYLCGEYTCSVNMDRLFPVQLASQHGGLFVTLEHRYYGVSQPYSNWTTDTMGHLQTSQALADIAHFIEARNKEWGKRKWVIIGCSYPGALSAWFRYKYPHLSVGAVASSAVVNAVLNFTDFDMQVSTSLQLSAGCYDLVANWTNFLQTKMEAGGDDEAAVRAAFNAPNDMPLDEFMWFVSDIFTISVQYGNRTNLCTYLAEKAPTATYADLQQWATWTGVAPADYQASVSANTTIDENKNMRQWYWQMCAELGYFQGPAASNPARSALLNYTFWQAYCERIFGDKVQPDINATNTQNGGVNLSVRNLLMLNGMEDPWQWASKTPANNAAKENPTNSFELILNKCVDCGHCQELYTPKATDSAVLNATRARVSDLVQMWLSDTEVYDASSLSAQTADM